MMVIDAGTMERDRQVKVLVPHFSDGIKRFCKLWVVESTLPNGLQIETVT